MNHYRFPIVLSWVLFASSLQSIGFATAGVEADLLAPDSLAPNESAAVEDLGSVSGQRLLDRVEFEQLGLLLTGVATFQDQTACFIRHPGATNSLRYKLGDLVGEFRIGSIEHDTVGLEREGERFWLSLDISGFESALVSVIPPDSEPVAFLDEPSSAETIPSNLVESIASPIASLRSPTGRKIQTRHYATAILIEDGSRTKARRQSYRGGAKGSSSHMFIRPLKGRMTSKFGYRRHPMGRGRRFHHGLDIAASYGNDVRAAADGKVLKRSYTQTLGRYVVIGHANGFKTLYAHLSRRLVKVGQRVDQGGTIGRVGSTGRSTGPHLHFEIQRNGRAVDPAAYVRY